MPEVHVSRSSQMSEPGQDRKWYPDVECGQTIMFCSHTPNGRVFTYWMNIRIFQSMLFVDVLCNNSLVWPDVSVQTTPHRTGVWLLDSECSATGCKYINGAEQWLTILDGSPFSKSISSLAKTWWMRGTHCNNCLFLQMHYLKNHDPGGRWRRNVVKQYVFMLISSPKTYTDENHFISVIMTLSASGCTVINPPASEQEWLRASERRLCANDCYLWPIVCCHCVVKTPI